MLGVKRDCLLIVALLCLWITWVLHLEHCPVFWSNATEKYLQNKSACCAFDSVFEMHKRWPWIIVEECIHLIHHPFYYSYLVWRWYMQVLANLQKEQYIFQVTESSLVNLVLSICCFCCRLLPTLWPHSKCSKSFIETNDKTFHIILRKRVIQPVKHSKMVHTEFWLLSFLENMFLMLVHRETRNARLSVNI